MCILSYSYILFSLCGCRLCVSRRSTRLFQPKKFVTMQAGRRQRCTGCGTAVEPDEMNPKYHDLPKGAETRLCIQCEPLPAAPARGSIRKKVQEIPDRPGTARSAAPEKKPVFGAIPEVLNGVKLAQEDRKALQAIRDRVLQRTGGALGFVGMRRTIKSMDEDGNTSLNRREFLNGLAKIGVPMGRNEVEVLFDAFDRNRDGTIDITEFMRGIRGEMNDRRRKITLEAFACIDVDGSGEATYEEMHEAYGKTLYLHPEVVAGKKTEEQILKEFMEGMGDKDGDAKISAAEFLDYYEDLSANIDDDDYFELMMRNAWHLSGGEGAAANTTCRRVLVVHGDDSQEIVELKNDLGVDYTNLPSVIAKLEKQGVTDIKRVELSA